MSVLRIYLYGIGQKVIIPTMVETEDGIFLEREPVRIFSISDIAGWKGHAYRALTSGNELVATPDDEPSPGSFILERLGLQKWYEFEKRAVMYYIHTGVGFIQVYVTGRNKEGLWTTGDRHRTFSGKAPLEVVLDEVAEDLMREPEAVEMPTTLLLGG